MTYFIKAVALLFGITLLGFAGLQFNDPDPLVWIFFYTICALVPLQLVAGKFVMPVFWCAAGICAIQLWIAAPGAYMYYLHRTEEPLMQAMNPAKPYIEEAREFLGSLIACVIVLLSRFAKPLAVRR